MSRSNAFGPVASAVVLSLVVASTACAKNHKDTREAPAAPEFGANTEFEIKSGRGVIEDPTVLVVFEKVGAEWCPIDTQFKVGPTPLATGVPTLTKSKSDPPRNTMRWKAVDTDLKPLTGLINWHYALVFHPFHRAGAGRFISKPAEETLPDGSKIVVEQVGPFELRWEEQIPVGVVYKYSIVRVVDVSPDPGRKEWEILTNCKPLDPNIRVW